MCRNYNPRNTKDPELERGDRDGGGEVFLRVQMEHYPMRPSL